MTSLLPYTVVISFSDPAGNGRTSGNGGSCPLTRPPDGSAKLPLPDPESSHSPNGFPNFRFPRPLYAIVDQENDLTSVKVLVMTVAKRTHWKIERAAGLIVAQLYTAIMIVTMKCAGLRSFRSTIADHVYLAKFSEVQFHNKKTK